MKLDQTQVRIRERNVLELLDLSLQMLRVYWRPCLLLTLVGAFPLAIVNAFLFEPLLDPLQTLSEAPAMYLWSQWLAVIIEAPLASVLLTTYLGHAVFDEAPTLRRVMADAFRHSGQLAWTLLGLRGIALLLLINLWAALDPGEFDPWRVLGTLLVVMTALVIRTFRPFVVEVIVLEQPQWASTNPLEPSLGQRSAQIHNPASGMLLGRGLLTAGVGLCLVWILFGGLATLYGFLGNDWLPTGAMLRVIWPLALWLVVGYLAIVRFLGYLDVRIRQEGWEVELLMRAEAQKLGESWG